MALSIKSLHKNLDSGSYVQNSRFRLSQFNLIRRQLNKKKLENNMIVQWCV